MQRRRQATVLDGSKKRSRLAVGDGEPPELEISTKIAAAKVFPCVVGILSRHLPADMAEFKVRSRIIRLSKAEAESRGEIVFWGSGIVIECEEEVVTHKYFSTIITAATLFVRTNGVQPHDIQVDVYLWDDKLCNAKVLTCDFHYNLAALRIETDSPLQTATLRGLDDVVSIHCAENPDTSFSLLPHSDLFKIFPRTKIITVGRTFRPRNAHIVGSGLFGTTSLDTKLDCYELYWVKNSNHPGKSGGGAIINCHGEVTGIMFYNSPFLPTNIVSRWWEHFKSCGRHRRPWHGLEVANLHSLHLDFLGKFMRKFPDVSTGVLVTKVSEDSPAYCSGIRPKDVIVKCDGKFVHSKLEFFDVMWDKVGESVELDALRASDGERLKLSMTVGETSPDKFYQWQRNVWTVLAKNETR